MATCYNRYTRRYVYCSNWSRYGRWVALVVILVAAILFFFLMACISQRRRRKAGRTPLYMTGWTSKLPGGKLNGQSYNPQSNYQSAPPQYNQTQNQYPDGGYYGQNQNGANQSYFGGQRNDVEMQAPQNVYNNNQYAPPAGPPPAKY
ncbi:hypothetical protein LTR05_006454 [Lithohypha guttulata]|uniref:Uncharacterized protein n=1 Tax=Lithohypha guttulata TaxID=1690604 RepID=A0AAN7SXE4_9EURO|nr:hypothetical protein LTR05_006454 [Lithohypha guttulata]